jgi:hypothetical protein
MDADEILRKLIWLRYLFIGIGDRQLPVFVQLAFAAIAARLQNDIPAV